LVVVNKKKPSDEAVKKKKKSFGIVRNTMLFNIFFVRKTKMNRNAVLVPYNPVVSRPQSENVGLYRVFD